MTELMKTIRETKHLPADSTVINRKITRDQRRLSLISRWFEEDGELWAVALMNGQTAPELVWLNPADALTVFRESR